MSSRDRDSKSLQDKLKVFFKKGPSAPLPARNELVISAELERELSADTPQGRRLRALKELADKVLHIRVQDGGVERLWSCTRDLLEDPNPEARHTALSFLRCVADGQAEWLGVMRTILFRFLRETHATHPPEDSIHRFKLLHTLTNTGKNIKCFEEQIGSFLVEWLPQIQSPTLLVEFLQLVINVVKFNASYLDEEIVHAIVNNACYVCAYWSESGAVLSALSLLEAVVSYSLPPRAALRAFVAALCRTVNIEHYCQPSWKLMRCVVGADIGHAALQEMADILCQQDAGGEADAGLLRGAVFYINMALWGPRRVPTLKVSFLAVLPAFQKALQGNQPVVTYEVVLALQSLVARVPHDLTEPAWDALLQILRTVIDQDRKLDPPNELIHSRLHALITSIEQLEDAGHYTGDSEALLDLIDYCGHDRPESSTLRVVSGRAALVSPARAGWLATAAALADRYIRLEPRLSVRLHTLHALHAIIKRYRHAYEEELLERVGVPVLSACALDADATLRAAVAKALAALAEHTSGDACTDLIDLLEKIMNRPFEVYVTDVPVPQCEGCAAGGAASGTGEAAALRAAAEGLIALARARLLRPPAAHALRTLLVLINHLDTHYKRPALFQHHPDIRIKIFDLVFCLRANAFNHVGMCCEPRGGGGGGSGGGRARPTCSPLLLVEPPAARGHPPHAVQTRDLPSGACILPVGRAAHALTTALTRETDWTVLSHVLRALPALLQARALAVGRRAHDIDLLASTLCSMLCDRSLNLPETLRAAGGGRVLVSEFHAAALPALGALAPYHAALEPHTQQRIVRCLLKYGMVLRTPQPYINALTIFTLETRDTMVKMLPEVLLDLSKISDTKVIASPMLEFLSTLTRLPRVFASFVEDQYMSVFAILLPYTNPSRYNHYVVSLAHHVIAAWFLKCRLSYRRNFVRFIIHGLHNYIIMPFEEQLQYKSNNFQQATANEDSSNRKRSSSLGSKGVSRAPLSSGGAAGAGGSSGARGANALSASAAFHVELTETCVDLLARYTFTPCSVKPHRSEIAEFLFNGGQSTTWLVGHKLITITTSGCLQNTIKQGLCDRCAVLCRQHTETASSPLPAPPADRFDHAAVQVQVTDGSGSEQPLTNHQPTQTGVSEVKRYSKHSLQHSRSTETSCSSLSISDALLPPSSGHTTRQNSAENKTSDPVTEALNNFSQRFEKISKEVEGEEGGWSRVGALAGAGACPCWCAHWAEVHVRSPTGDVAWVMRMQNQMSWDYLSQSPLQEVLALLAPRAPTSSASSGIGDSRHDMGSESDGRSRSGSGSEPSRAPDLLPQDLHKSSSDSVVAAERRPPHAASHCIVPPQPHRMSTQPINIPGSPQRQSSSSTTDDDDLLLLVHEGKITKVTQQGKFRHPVRRSNSSPEMSSSWKLPAAGAAGTEAPGAGAEAASRPPSDDDITVDVDDMILLPSCEPTSTSMSLHASKKAAKKSDMRVSCEAIPEEMSGTSPLAQNAQAVPTQTVRNTPAAQPAQPAQPAPAPQPTHHHPHLMTYNSDPGASGSASETGVEAMPSAAPALQKVASDSIVQEGRASKPPAGPRVAPRDRDDLPPLARSKRSNTISVMSPTRRHRETLPSRVANASGGAAGGAAGGAGAERDTVGGAGGGVTPSFVLLQLYHNMSTYPITPPVPGEAPSILNPLAERPLKVTGVQNERTIKNLDLVPPVETYKVGVLYVGPGQQDNEVAILKNEYGSVRYAEFLSQLGSLVSLDGGDEQPHLFLNLEKGGKDGHYTYVWHDDIMQVLFHVATAMPSSARDPSCNEKRKYIGNDFVSIVYNDSGADFNIHTIKGQFNFCIVVVEPFEHGLNRVFVKTKDERIRTKFVAHLEPHVISDQNVPLLARQMALHCSLASQISQSLKMCGGQPYASNSLERLRHIKRLRARLEAERLAAAARAPAPYADTRRDSAKRVQMDDFNDYT